MSFQAMSWAVEQKCDNAFEKITLLMLANRSNPETGQCNPSHKRLAAECCMSQTTIKKAIKALEKKGLLMIKHIKKGDSYLSNQYILQLDKLLIIPENPENNPDPVGSDATGGGVTRPRSVARKPRVSREKTKGMARGDYKTVIETVIETVKESEKEKNEEKSKIIKKQTPLQILSEFKITGELADDFISHRKEKKAIITKTALKGFKREAKKAKIPIQRAVEISIERGWTGFNANWDWDGKSNGGYNGHKKPAISAEEWASRDF